MEGTPYRCTNWWFGSFLPYLHCCVQNSEAPCLLKSAPHVIRYNEVHLWCQNKHIPLLPPLDCDLTQFDTHPTIINCRILLMPYGLFVSFLGIYLLGIHNIVWHKEQGILKRGRSIGYEVEF